MNNIRQNVYRILFVLFLIEAIFVAPFIYSAGGTDTIKALGWVAALGGGLLGFLFGVFSVKNSQASKTRKIIAYILVVVAALASMLAGAADFQI